MQVAEYGRDIARVARRSKDKDSIVVKTWIQILTSNANFQPLKNWLHGILNIKTTDNMNAFYFDSE